MPRSMLSPVAALAVGVSSLPLTRRTHPGSLTLTAQRIIAGHAFSSAAWLDRVTSTSAAPSSVLSLCGLR